MNTTRKESLSSTSEVENNDVGKLSQAVPATQIDISPSALGSQVEDSIKITK